MKIENVLQRLSSTERTLGYFAEAIKEETSGRNSPWRIHETTRNVGSREVAGWLEAGELITLGYRINVDR
jgi:hypothetical protein